MISNLLAMPLKFKLVTVAAAACLGGGGVFALAVTSTHGSPAVLTAASAAKAAPAAVVTSPAAPGPAAPAPSAAAPVAAASAAPAAVAPKAVAPKAPVAKVTTAPVPPAAPATAAPAPPPVATVTCPSNQELTDPEINWLLQQVAKTAATNAAYAPGEATIDAGLQPLLGQNLCASQAQPVVSQLCANSGALQLINAMSSQMPFYVKAVVGNPCTANLVTLLPKLSPFASSLS